MPGMNTAQLGMNIGENTHDTLPTEHILNTARTAMAMPDKVRSDSGFQIAYAERSDVPTSGNVVVLVPKKDVQTILNDTRFAALLEGDIDTSGETPALSGKVVTVKQNLGDGQIAKFHFLDAGAGTNVPHHKTGQLALDGRKLGALIGGIVHARDKGGNLATGSNAIYIPPSLLNPEFLAGVGEGIGNMAHVPLNEHHVKGDSSGTDDVIQPIADVRRGADSIGVISNSEATARGMQAALIALGVGEDRASNKALARFLGELPREALTTEVFARVVVNLVDQLNERFELPEGKLKVEVYGIPGQGDSFDRELTGNIREIGQGMGLLEAVHAGSVMPGPYYVRVKYRGNSDSNVINVAVGKGLVFDDGGDQHKGKHSLDMEQDMLGAASVVASLQHLVKSNPNSNFDLVMGVCENALGSNAQRAGNIIRSCNGKTVRVVNTDAEGRLQLSDTLAATRIILGNEGKEVGDMSLWATLTGHAPIVAGRSHCLISENTHLVRGLADKARRAGVPGQECTLEDVDFKAMKDGEYADFVNVAPTPSPSPRGHITAAAFIQAVAGLSPEERARFVHGDIAADCSFVKGAKQPDLKHAVSPAGEAVTAITEWMDMVQVRSAI